MWILLLQYSILYLMRIRRIYNSPAPSFLGWTGEFRNLIRIIQFIEFTSYPTVKIEVQHFPRPPSSLERSGKDEGGRGKSRGVTSNTKKEKGDRCLPKKD